MIIDRAQGYDDDKERHNQQVAQNHRHDADERNERQPKGEVDLASRAGLRLLAASRGCARRSRGC